MPLRWRNPPPQAWMNYFNRVTDIIGDMLYPDTCGFILLNEARDMLKPHFSYRGTNSEDLALYLPLTIGITGKVAASGTANLHRRCFARTRIL